jgi:hypothetical protein
MAEVTEQSPISPKYKLWQSLNEGSYYTKSYDDFDKQFSTPEQINKLHGALNESQYYTKSAQDFTNQFFTPEKKNPVQNVGGNISGLSNNGSNLFPTSQNADLIPVLPEHRLEVRQGQIQDLSNKQADLQAQDKRTRKLLGDKAQMAQIFSDIDKSRKERLAEIDNPSSQYYDDIRKRRAEEEAKGYKGPITFADRVHSVTGDIYKGLGDIGKGVVRAAGTLSKAVTPDSIGSDGQFDSDVIKANEAIDKFVNFGNRDGEISPEKKAAINKNIINGAISSLAEFAPALATAERTGGTSFFFNDYERSYENIDKQSRDAGLDLTEGQKQAYATVNGVVSATLMSHNLHSLMGNANDKATQSIINKVSQDVIGDLVKSGEDLTADNLKRATTVTLDKLADRAKNFGIKSLKGSAISAGDLGALEALKIQTDKLTNTATGKKVFNMDNASERFGEAVKGGALLGGVFSILKAPMLLAKGGEERNSVIESLYNDPSNENVQNVKDAATEHLANKGFSEDELAHVNNTIDQIHTIAKSLPKGLPEEKQTKVVDLIMERNELEKGVSEQAEGKAQLDPAFTQNAGQDDLVTQHRIDSINDKIKSIATDVPVKYFKGENEGEYFKQFGEKEPEKIDEERYYIEKPSREIVPKEQKQDDTQPTTTEGDNNGTVESVAEPIQPAEIQSQQEEVNPNQKAIDLINHGLIVPEGFKENDPSARIDLGMTSAEKRKAVNDVSNGNYETAPAKKLIAKVMEFEQSGEYPVIEGLGGSSIRRQGITTEEINQYLDDAKSNKIGELSDRQIDELNKSAKEIGITDIGVEDFRNYEQSRENSFGREGDGRTVGMDAETLQQPQNDTPASGAQNSRSEAAQGENITTLRNAEVESKRKEYGFDEPLPRKGATDEELTTKADEQIAKGYDAHELMDKVLNDKKPIIGVESVILAKFQGAKEDELLNINDKIEKSIDKSDIAFNQLIAERDRILEDIHRAYQASEASGTVASDALRARQVKILRDYSLANLLIRKREANGGKRLTEEQLEEVTATYKDLKAKEEALNKHIAELQNQESELLAKQTIRKVALETRREKRSQKAEVIDKEIEDVFASLKKIAREQRQTLSANPIPIEYIPEIAKLVKLFTQKGVLNLEGIVDNIYNGLKDDFDGLTKEHVKEIIGSLSENDPQKAVKSRIRTAIKDFKRRTQQGDFTKTKREPIKLDKEGLELRDALEKARYEYELALHRDAYKNRTKAQKARDIVTEVMNVPRALMASTDFSAPLRQGLVMTAAHPIKASQAFIHMFKSAASNKTFDRWFYDLKESSDYASMKESKLYIADPHKPELAAKEEQFMTNLANKIPLIGKLVEGSERAYVAYLNKLRVDLFRQSADLFEMEGKTAANSPELYKGLAKWINNATGRGTMANEQLAQSLNSVLFSPRLIASRINLLNPAWYAKLPKEVRKQAIGDMVKTTAVIMSALGLASLSGLNVELDPRSSDFGKIRDGNRRWDILGGFSQYIRFFAQILSGQTKSTKNGKISKLNDGKRLGRTRFDVALAMARSKLAPVPGFAVNTLAGKDAIGKDFDPVGSIPNLLIPLTLQDTYSAIKDNGLEGLFTTGIPTTFGVGVQSYSDKKK